MHYYQFNIGDYTSHTARLSLIEDLAYRRLLDLYYLNERPFNGCSSDVAREIGLVEHQKEVDYVLSKFFKKVDDVWTQDRAEREITAYQNKINSASKAGKASAKARKLKASEQRINDSSTDVQPNKNQEPRTKNQEPINKVPREKAKRFCPPALDEIKGYCLERSNTVDPERFIDHYTSNGWQVGKNKMKDWKAAVRTWEKSSNNGGKQKPTLSGMNYGEGIQDL